MFSIVVPRNRRFPEGTRLALSSLTAMHRPGKLRSSIGFVAVFVACGVALLSSCAGGALPPAPFLVLAAIVAVGGWLSACSRSLTPSADAATGGTSGADAFVDPPRDAVVDHPPDAVDRPPTPACLTDSQFDLSSPYMPGAGAGWERCCLRGETRLCPSSMLVACNYGLGTIFNADGTCGRGFDGGGEVAVDAMPDTPPDATAEMRSFIEMCASQCFTGQSCFNETMQFQSGQPSPEGWGWCCLGGQHRLCPTAGLFLSQCNFSWAAWCGDGTCVPGQAASCPPVDASDANATAP
jgi:hypothetical protein